MKTSNQNAITEFALKVHEAMQVRLSECKSQDTPLLTKIETCFGIVQKAWLSVAEQCCLYSFASKAEEVLFHKSVKPLFHAEMELCHLVYHAALFLPPNPVDQILFWQREGTRMEKFREEHKEFLNYYQSGRTDRDESFYLFASKTGASCSLILSDFHNQPSSSKDHLIGIFNALEKYLVYVQEQCNRLGQEKTDDQDN